MVVTARRGPLVTMAAAALLALAACKGPAAPAATRQLPPAAAVAQDPAGGAVDLRAAASRAPFTVVELFSAHCPCQRAHDERLRALHAEFAPRGVQFLAVDAEVGASAERARAERAARGYPFPLLFDPSGQTIDALGADYATYTVVLDHEGRVLYGGGIDSDKQHLTASPRTYLRDALTDLTDGRPPRTPSGKTLGCSLERP